MADSVVFGLAVDLRRLRTGLDQSVGLVRGSVGRINAGFGLLANPFGGLIAAAGVGGLGLVITRAIETGDEIAKMARRIGIGTTALQELRHAAGLSAVSTQDLENGLRNLNRRFGEATSGDLTAQRLFQDLGLSATDASGRVRDAGGALDEIADRFAAITDPAQRTRLAMELFGRAGTQLIPLLEGGSEGLREMRREAHELGLVLSAEMLKEAEAASDALGRLSTVVKVSLTRAVLTVGPLIKDLADDLARLGGRVKPFFDSLLSDARAPVEELERRLKATGRVIEDLRAQLSGQTFEGKLNLFLGEKERLQKNLDVALKGQAAIQKLIDQRKKLDAALEARAAGGFVSAEQLEAIDKLRQKVIEAAVPDAVAQSVVKFRHEIETLAAAVPARAAEIRALGQAFEDIKATAERAKAAITDTQAATLAKSLGLGDTNLFAGFQQLDEIKTQADQFGQAIQGLVARGVPLSATFDLIAKAQEALALKAANLREAFADQPAVLEQIRTELSGIDFGQFQRGQDALVRGLAGAREGTAQFIDTIEGVNRVVVPALSNAGIAALSVNQSLATLPPVIVTAAQEMVILTANADQLAVALARVRIEAVLASAAVGATANVAVPGGPR